MTHPRRQGTPQVDPSGRTHRRIGTLGPTAPYDVVLLDRDGTLNVHAPGYRTPGDFALLPGAAAAVAALTRAGCRAAVITNQRGIATGALDWDDAIAVNTVLLDAVEAAGGAIDDVRLCPHAEGECRCRKPLPGLIEALFAENPHLRRERSVMVGDSDADAGAASAAGVAFIRVDSQVGLAGVLDSLLGHEEGTISTRS